MPFARPTSFFGDKDGNRDGATDLFGWGAFFDNFGTTFLGAGIGAANPYGVIHTDVWVGFDAGVAPRGKSMLTVIVSGTATTCNSEVNTLGAYSHAAASLSITIQEWTVSLLQSRRPRLLRMTDFNPTIMQDDWSAVIGFQHNNKDGTPFMTVAQMPVSFNRRYICTIHLIQFCEVWAVTGTAGADSTVVFAFPPVFFNFS